MIKSFNNNGHYLSIFGNIGCQWTAQWENSWLVGIWRQETIGVLVPRQETIGVLVPGWGNTKRLTKPFLH